MDDTAEKEQGFSARVQRCEQEARDDMSGYRRQVFYVAVGGYLHLLVVIAAPIAVALWLAHRVLFTDKYVVVPSVLLAMLLVSSLVTLRALLSSDPTPQGVVVPEGKAPALRAEIELVRRALDAPPVDVILITDEVNAGVAQVARLGLLGKSRRYLVLGLPLMLTLPRNEFRAVLAHEFAHLSRKQSWITTWVYRARSAWIRTLVGLQERPDHIDLFSSFIRRFGPYFEAYSFVLARAHEYDADRAAAELTSPRDIVDALARVELQSASIDKLLWEPINQRIKQQHEPPFPMRELMSTPDSPYRRAASASDLSTLHRIAVQVADSRDPHPTLEQRARALSADIRTPPASKAFAAQLFESDLDEVINAVDAWWRARVGPQWAYTYHVAHAAHNRLIQLAEYQGPLPLEQMVELANLTDEFEGPRAALARWRAVADEHPHYHWAQTQMGKIMLSLEDDEGVAVLQGVIAHGGEDAFYAAAFLTQHHQQKGDVAAARAAEVQAQGAFTTVVHMDHERSLVGDLALLKSHDLSAEQLDGIRSEFAQVPYLHEPRIARKAVEHQAAMHHYVMGVTPKPPGLAIDRDDAETKAAAAIAPLAQRLSTLLNGRATILVVPYNCMWGLKRKLKKLDPNGL